MGLKFFGVNTVKDKPTKNGFSESMKDGIKPVKQKYLQNTLWIFPLYKIGKTMKQLKKWILMGDTHVYLEDVNHPLDIMGEADGNMN